MNRSPAFIRVLAAGAALSLSACEATREQPTRNPPAPELEPEPKPDPEPMRNPPPPQSVLPTWDAVGSNHPEGATNPPSPVLQVTADGSRCYKSWQGGMLPLPEEVRTLGGQVLTSPDQATGTEIQCPPEATAVLERYRNPTPPK